MAANCQKPPFVVLIVILCSGIGLCNAAVECSIADYGAVGDGHHLNTKQIQKALDDERCSSIVVPSAGTFLTGALNVTRNNVTLVVKGTLLAQTALSGFPVIPHLPSYPSDRDIGAAGRYQPFIFLYNISDVVVTGNGSISGQGQWWWKQHKEHQLRWGRPRLFEVYNSQRVTVSNVRLENSPFWTLHLVYSDHIRIEHVTIYNPTGAPNTDGIDPDSSSNVLIDNVDIHTSDDLIAIKSGKDAAGRAFARPCVNVTVQNSRMRAGAGLAIGSEVAGGVENVIFRNLDLDLGVGNCVRLKASVTDGAYIRNILYENIHLKGIGQAVYANTCYECHGSEPPAPVPTKISNVTLQMIHGEAAQAADAKCTSDIPCSFNLVDWDVHSILGWTCEHVTGRQRGQFRGHKTCFK